MVVSILKIAIRCHINNIITCIYIYTYNRIIIYGLSLDDLRDEPLGNLLTCILLASSPVAAIRGQGPSWRTGKIQRLPRSVWPECGAGAQGQNAGSHREQAVNCFFMHFRMFRRVSFFEHSHHSGINLEC